jgi:hypothetical protein
VRTSRSAKYKLYPEPGSLSAGTPHRGMFSQVRIVLLRRIPVKMKKLAQVKITGDQDLLEFYRVFLLQCFDSIFSAIMPG